MSQFILGIRPQFDGLEIDPCVPSNFGSFTVERKFRGATYEITVENATGVQKGVQSITLDGKAINGTLLPVCSDGEKHSVHVTMG